MISSKWEYLILLVLFDLIGISLFSNRIQKLKRKSVIITLIVFFFFSVILEIIALNLGWWHFNLGHICGLELLHIPIEEYFLFLSFYFIAIIVWEYLEDELG
jgi:lycopene cyclase domain-containing protein